MKILVVGSGGREHAIAWRLAQDDERHDIFCAPGNAGTAAVATNVAVGAEDVAGIVAWARANNPDLVVVGPEVPLVKGLVDALLSIGVPTFGPVAAGARLEGSKRFAKEVMTRRPRRRRCRRSGCPSSSRPTASRRARASSWPRRPRRRRPPSTTCSSPTSSARRARRC